MKISDMTVKTTLTGDELVPIYDPSESEAADRNKAIAVSELQGVDGAQWFILSAAPTTQGVDGDVAIVLSTRVVYQNVSGTWTSKGTLSGIQGLVKSVNSVQPDSAGAVTLTISNITGLQDQLTALQTLIDDYKTALLATDGASLIGFDSTTDYAEGTVGYALKQVYT